MSKITSLDLVRRVFRRDRPNELWLTDITEHPTREGKIYLAAVLDVFSRLVVGWAIDSTQTTTPADSSNPTPPKPGQITLSDEAGELHKGLRQRVDAVAAWRS